MAAVTWWQGELNKAARTPQGRKEIAKGEVPKKWWQIELEKAMQTPKGRKEIAKGEVPEPTEAEKEEYRKAYRTVESAYLSCAAHEYCNGYSRRQAEGKFKVIPWMEIPMSTVSGFVFLPKDIKDKVQAALDTMARLKNKYPQGQFAQLVGNEFNRTDFVA
ncbi:hypothetical protein IKQ21_02665 [bacterium]|nr:hypothetical protein [bacterium]